MIAFVKRNPLLLIFILWSVIYMTLSLILQSELITKINSYVFTCVLASVTITIFRHAIKNKGNNISLYGALGLCCLTIGHLYFILIDLTAHTPDFISVGNFSIDCCYLFFLAVLMELKAGITNKCKFLFTIINSLATVITIFCAYAVITNNDLIMNIAVMVLDIICAVISISLLRDKNRFFAMIILILTSLDIISLLGVPLLIIFIQSVAVELYLLLGKSLITVKVGEKCE